MLFVCEFVSVCCLFFDVQLGNAYQFLSITRIGTAHDIFGKFVVGSIFILYQCIISINAFLRTKPGMFCLIGWFKDAILERISSLCWIFITLDVRVGCFSELCGWIMYLFYNIYIEKFEKPGNEALPIQSDGYCCCHYTMTNIPLHHHHHLDGKRCYRCQHHHLFVIISKILVYNLSHCHHHRHPTWHSRYLLTCHCHTTITIFSAPTIALL